jgi:hypothetical protein
MKKLKTYAVVFTSRIATYDEINTNRLLKLLEQQLDACSDDTIVGRYLINCSSLELKEIKND